MTAGRILLILLAGAITGFLTAFVAVPAQADPDDFYELDNEYDTYRPPWREREAWYIDGGTGVGGHDPGPSGQDRGYAVDLNRPVVFSAGALLPALGAVSCPHRTSPHPPSDGSATLEK